MIANFLLMEFSIHTLESSLSLVDFIWMHSNSIRVG